MINPTLKENIYMLKIKSKCRFNSKQVDNQSIIVTGEISYKLSDLIQIVSEIIGKKLKQTFLTN